MEVVYCIMTNYRHRNIIGRLSYSLNSGGHWGGARGYGKINDLLFENRRYQRCVLSGTMPSPPVYSKMSTTEPESYMATPPIM